MVLARVANIKSGWKSMFMVFTTAANDEQMAIVRLAFETIEKIVRDHFHYITETEITTFTDCVNCLIAFTNNPHSTDVALNAIAFLRYCALELAEGDIGARAPVQPPW
jgi:brefeldin A-inhibited guanine nucleotide-exchange protein